jgi:hypothetical protein
LGALGYLAVGLLTLGVFVVASCVLAAKCHRRWEDRADDQRASVWPWAVLFLVTVAALASLPVAATRTAEARTGWQDADGDGMLDGFVAGQYDYTDLVLWPLAKFWFVGLVCVTTASALIAIWLQRNELT